MSSMENCNLPISSHHIVGISSLIRCYLCEHGCTPLYCRRMTKCLLSGFPNANERLDYSCFHSFLLFIYIFLFERKWQDRCLQIKIQKRVRAKYKPQPCGPAIQRVGSILYVFCNNTSMQLPRHLFEIKPKRY